MFIFKKKQFNNIHSEVYFSMLNCGTFWMETVLFNVDFNQDERFFLYFVEGQTEL